MPPKSSRVTSSGQLRPHSRSSSATKLGANLQFTQKELQAAKHTDRSKKAYPHEAHAHGGKAAPPFVRANSSQRVLSKEQLAPQTKRQQAYPDSKVNNNGKAKAGFTIATPSEDGDDDEGWVSTESGAATPNHQDSDSDSNTASEADAPDPRQQQTQPQQARAPQPPQQPQQQPAHPSTRPEPTLPRIDTARPADFKQLSRMERNSTSRPSPPPVQPHIQQIPSMVPHQQQQQRAPATNNTRKDTIPTTDVPQPRLSPRSKRHSRPPSTHSITSKLEYQLRPHPLIRGQSYGSIHPPKPAPLAPLTVVPNSALPELSTSPGSAHDGVKSYMSSSPTSIKTSSGSPASSDVPHSGFGADRRFSISSARSVNTIPVVHPTIIRTSDRTRTLSTMSTTSSSAALSSLVHLPTVTRPPSPQTISFFPPVNPHANIEGIHPLLPPPYMSNHLTVLSRRTPIREAFDRVSRAKSAR
ncbi:unnamed protein product [Cyclocybe aegerita]|uniref:Uncharacterized protein n=1 Tax=Cyclocybe aegerita TaxID=1973307 RepID=A0A8S0VWD9_CYCAE|nr:unnamed protein product [Cyclocybe aegerita]